MTKPMARDAMYRRRRFDAEIIELCVRWYITYRLSYRDLVAMMAERSIVVSHTTIHRWVIHYVPEFEKRWNRFARPVNNSWRVDETFIKVQGKWNYLYRAVDKHGKTVDFLLRPDRSVSAAQAFFRKALSRCLPRWPRKITLDGLKQSHLALRLLRREDPKWKYVQVRCSQYLNNLIEQGSSSDQTPMRLDDGLQVFLECGHYIGRHRACPSDSEEAILSRARSTSELLVTEATLRTSTRIVRARECISNMPVPARESKPRS